MPNPNLDAAVKAAAANALENGYSAWPSAEALAIDMCTCDADVEIYDPTYVQESIERQGLLVPRGEGFVLKDQGESNDH